MLEGKIGKNGQKDSKLLNSFLVRAISYFFA